MTVTEAQDIKAAASKLIASATVLRSEVDPDDEEATFSLMDNIDHDYKYLLQLIESI